MPSLVDIVQYQKTFQLRSSYSSFSNIRRLDSAITRLRLMQTNLNAGRFKLGLHQDGMCTTCGVAEDGVHFIMFCSDTKDLRDQLLKTTKKINWNFPYVMTNIETVKIIAKYILINKSRI